MLNQYEACEKMANSNEEFDYSVFDFVDDDFGQKESNPWPISLSVRGSHAIHKT